MPKVVLGKRPESFKRDLKFQMVDGTEGMMEVHFKYRTLTEFGEFIDEFNKAAEAKQAAEKAARDKARQEAEERGETYSEPPLTEKELRRLQAEANADYLMRILLSWNLDVELTRENVVQLCDEVPGAAGEAIRVYRIAITEGRLGN